MHTLFTTIYNRSNAYITHRSDQQDLRKTVIGGREAIGARGEQNKNTQ